MYISGTHYSQQQGECNHNQRDQQSQLQRSKKTTLRICRSVLLLEDPRIYVTSVHKTHGRATGFSQSATDLVQLLGETVQLLLEFCDLLFRSGRVCGAQRHGAFPKFVDLLLFEGDLFVFALNEVSELSQVLAFLDDVCRIYFIVWMSAVIGWLLLYNGAISLLPYVGFVAQQAHLILNLCTLPQHPFLLLSHLPYFFPEPRPVPFEPFLPKCVLGYRHVDRSDLSESRQDLMQSSHLF